MKQVLIVTNYKAGRKKAIKYKKQVLKFVIKHTNNFKFINIDELGSTNVSDFDVILVMGGDGSINKVLPHLVNSDKILGIIPTGTANLLAANLGFSYNINKTLKIIEKNNIKHIDIMKINNNFCALRCGFGYDCDIICKTSQTLKNKFGYFAYFVTGIIFALRLRKKTYNLVIDGIEYNFDSTGIIIANVSNMYRNIVSVASNSAIDDGLIDIFVLKTSNPIAFFIEFLRIILNIKSNNIRAEYLKAKEIKLNGKIFFSHIDGEKQILKDEINISIQKSAIKVFSN